MREVFKNNIAEHVKTVVKGNVDRMMVKVADRLRDDKENILHLVRISRTVAQTKIVKRSCSCAGCAKDDCRECEFCLDKRMYGGEGKLKQRCMNRVCVK